MATSSARTRTALAVGDDRVVVRLVGEELLRGDLEIAQEAAPHEAARREPVRDAGVEADAGDVEEQASVDLPGVDAPLAAGERDVERPRGIERNLQLAREAVARTARNDGQRRVAERERRPHLVDRAVTAPGHNERHAARQRRRASSRAWPGRSVTNTSASTPCRSTSAAARSARARATSRRPPVPEMGLMMTATAVTEQETSRHRHGGDATHEYFKNLRPSTARAFC